MMLVWRLTVAYIGPRREQRCLGRLQIGTEVADVTRDSDTTFKVKRSKVNWQRGAYCGGLRHSLLLKPPDSQFELVRLVIKKSRLG